ncbi:MAG TPA: hypothetical protein VMZ30_13150 [Pyrinomonadaceae bacterium]|nr:hypothetical protein [Pyrinomonadaceae bacterium]
MSVANILTSQFALSKPFPAWIISRRDDLTWFIASPAIGYIALLALMAGFPILTAMLIWNLAIDGPHVFATASRTYFDKTARRKLGWRLWMIIPFALVGPVLWSTGFGWLFFLVITWAQYHVAKQHLGFVMLYKRKTGERRDVVLDKRFLMISLMLPWAIYLYRLIQIPGTQQLVFVVTLLYGAFVLFYLTHQIGKALRREICNFPKLLLLSVTIPLHWIAFAYASTLPTAEGLIVAGIATNVGHSLQYQRLTWFHNRNRYAGVTRSTIGMAAVVNSRLSRFLLTGIVLNLVFAALPQYAAKGNELLLSALIGANMLHYYLDSLIWRTRSDKELASALRLA